MDVLNAPNDAPNDGSDKEQSNHSAAGTTPSHNYDDELRVTGVIFPVSGNATAEIRRGMTILGTDGEVAGLVAAVVQPKSQPQADYILLSRPSWQIEYRMIPVELIRQVTEETVLLHIGTPSVDSLLQWARQTRS